MAGRRCVCREWVLSRTSFISLIPPMVDMVRTRTRTNAIEHHKWPGVPRIAIVLTCVCVYVSGGRFSTEPDQGLNRALVARAGRRLKASKVETIME